MVYVCHNYYIQAPKYLKNLNDHYYLILHPKSVVYYLPFQHHKSSKFPAFCSPLPHHPSHLGIISFNSLLFLVYSCFFLFLINSCALCFSSIYTCFFYLFEFICFESYNFLGWLCYCSGLTPLEMCNLFTGLSNLSLVG